MKQPWFYLVVCLVAMVPYFVDPATVDRFCLALILSRFCRQLPGECRKIRANPAVEEVAFACYDVIYVRHHVVARWDETVMAAFRVGMALASQMWPLSPLAALRAEETVLLAVATGLLLVLSVAKVVLTLKVWAFFLTGFAVSVWENWQRMAAPVRLALAMFDHVA